MTNSQLVRSAALRLAKTKPRFSPDVTRALSSLVSPGTNRRSPFSLSVLQHRNFAQTASDSPENVKNLKEMGIFDDRGLTVFDTLHDMQVKSCIAFADHNLFGTFKANEVGEGGSYEWMTYEEYAEKVQKCRAVLLDIGVQEFGKVGIISNNRWEWATLAAACYSMNATLVPMYEAQLPSDWTYIINDSGCCALFCATQDIFDRCNDQVLKSTPSIQATLCLDAPEGVDYAFSTAMAKAEVSSSTIIKPTVDDLADLIYTSGTTGKPKGVELTHRNIASNVQSAVRQIVDHVSHNDVSLAFLPWAHSYGQTCELWASISYGSAMGICRGVPHILEDLQYVKPNVLFAVPTLYKRIYDGVHNLMEHAPPLRKKLMQTALQLGHKNSQANFGHGDSLSLGEKLKFKALDAIVLSKIRDRFGGNLQHGFVAGAACPAEVLDFMDSLGIPVCEGYGLTETSPIIAINTPSDRKVGYVGRPIADVTVYIIGEDGKPVPPGQEGEICCVGPNVMQGYYRNQEATDEVISVAPDGKSRMFHTGDMGRMGEDGFVKVTGRLKEQYKLENGKYVVPTPIEEAIGLSRFISQVVLHGDNRPYNIVLVVPDWAAIRKDLGMDENVPEEELANDEGVKELMDNAIRDSCAQLKKFEVPTKWAFVAPFTAANNMLTPKMSIRRHKVVEVYKDLIDHLYGDDVEAYSHKDQEQKEVA